jgi:hypothetical protein
MRAGDSSEVDGSGYLARSAAQQAVEADGRPQTAAHRNGKALDGLTRRQSSLQSTEPPKDLRNMTTRLVNSDARELAAIKYRATMVADGVMRVPLCLLILNCAVSCAQLGRKVDPDKSGDFFYNI